MVQCVEGEEEKKWENFCRCDGATLSPRIRQQQPSAKRRLLQQQYKNCERSERKEIKEMIIFTDYTVALMVTIEAWMEGAELFRLFIYTAPATNKYIVYNCCNNKIRNNNYSVNEFELFALLRFLCVYTK